MQSVALSRFADPVDQDVWWRLGRATVGSAFRAAFGVRFSGTENIPAEGGAVLAYNHVSVLDPIPVALAAGRAGRSVHFLALSELFDTRFVGWALKRTRQIPVDRGAGTWAAIERAASVIRAGALAGLSPEGTVGEGSMLGRAQKGAARIALSAGAPVLPVGVWGTQARWPKSGLRWGGQARPVVGVAVGQPIPSEGEPRDPWAVRRLTEAVMWALGAQVRGARLLAESEEGDAHA